ncbi:MAG: MgtC/SapB family protein [Bacteriovoracaceae bacterium]|nr:MgtC/SapB family protein [Bacteriovoracaceae bacterium]
MHFNSDNLHIYHQLFISFGLGLIVGLQREWSKSPIAGIRSYALITILGTVSAILASSFGPWVIGGGFISVIAFLVINHPKDSGGDHRELVSEIGLVLMFCTGIIVANGPILFASALAGVIAILFHLKMEIHQLVRKFSESEIKSILQFVLITLVIFPVIPNQAYGPYDFFNPYNVWLMVSLIVGIGLTGYLTSKFLGEKSGVILSGLLGGLISSTATTFSYARMKVSEETELKFSSGVILIAWATLYGRVFLELFITAPSFDSIRLPLLILVVSSIAPFLWLKRYSQRPVNEVLPNKNPTDLKQALAFAMMYSLVLLASSYLKEMLGTTGLSLLAIASGITDVDAITLSTGRQFQLGTILESEAHLSILIAIVSNVSAKGLIVFVLGHRNLKRLILWPWLITLMTGLILILSSMIKY